MVLSYFGLRIETGKLYKKYKTLSRDEIVAK